MAHGYMREFDENQDRDDGDRWRNENRHRDERWRSEDDHRFGNEQRDRGMMFSERDRQRDDGRSFGREHSAFTSESGGRSEWDRGYWSPRQDSGWEQNRDWPSHHESSSDYRERGWADDRNQGQRSRHHPDDHYRSWRDKQIQSLDQDYDDYCREREQQFHQDFDSWRQQRYGGNPGPLRTGMTQTGLSEDPSGMAEAEASNRVGTTPPDPMDTATLGTTPRNKQSGK